MRSLCLILALLSLTCGELNGQTTGPPNGSLVIVGGSMEDETITRRFIELSGGIDSSIVVIPTASGDDSFDDSFYALGLFRNQGARNVTLLHTRDREEANSSAFVAAIRGAGGVWFSGGRQWRLADAYLGTKTEDELWRLLDRGGAIGGSSAGATIQGSYLARGDSKTNTIMMGDHEEGFGFLTNTAIDQHLLPQNRQFDLIEIIEARPELLGIGIDEDTAIIVEGNSFEVIGASVVAIYDSASMIDEEGKFYFLRPGDRFDLSDRKAYRTFRGESRPLRQVQKRNWQEH